MTTEVPMLSTVTHFGEGTKAFALAAAVALVIVSAAYVAQADLNGSRATMAAQTTRKIADEHKSVCERLGQAETTAWQSRCLEELMHLQQWHEELSATLNESLL